MHDPGVFRDISHDCDVFKEYVIEHYIKSFYHMWYKWYHIRSFSDDVFGFLITVHDPGVFRDISHDCDVSKE